MKHLFPWLKNITKQLEVALLFIVSFAFASIFGSIVTHRNSNPYNITNLANLGFEANYIRVVVFVFSGFAIFFLLLFLRKKYSKLLRYTVAAMATAVVLVNISLPLPTQQIDMFHNGEQLSPALEFREGKPLFTDLFFLHGAGEDILIPNLAFTIFNNGEPSIGSYLLIYKLIQTLTVFILFIVLAVILKHRLTFLLAITWISGSIYLYAGLGSGKYIFLYLTILLYYKLLVTPPKGRIRHLIPLLIGVLSAIGLFYSIEVGVVLLAINALVIIGLLITRRTKDNYSLHFKSLTTISTYITPLFIIAGSITVHLVALLVIGLRAYGEFIKQSFSDIPKYQSALFSYGNPQYQGDAYSYGFWLPIILLPLSILMLSTIAVLQYKKNRAFDHKTIFAAILLLSCLATLRSGVARPDFFHIATVAMPFFLAAFFIIEYFITTKKPQMDNTSFYWAPVLFLVLLIWPQTTWNIGTMLVTNETSKQSLLTLKDVSSRPDNDWLNNEQRDVVSYIKSHSKSSDGLYVFTAEPLYYYLTDRPNPSRFFLTWFADPQPFTDELLASLKANPPKYVLYSGPGQYDSIDGINIKERVPEVNEWILKNYPVKTTIDNTVILSKK